MENVFEIKELAQRIFHFVEDTSACYFVSINFMKLAESSTVNFNEACKKGRWNEVYRFLQNEPKFWDESKIKLLKKGCYIACKYSHRKLFPLLLNRYGFDGGLPGSFRSGNVGLVNEILAWGQSKNIKIDEKMVRQCFRNACKFGNLELVKKAKTLLTDEDEEDGVFSMYLGSIFEACKRSCRLGKFGHFQIFRYIQEKFSFHPEDYTEIMNFSLRGACFSGNLALVKIVLLSRPRKLDYERAFVVITKREYKKWDRKMIRMLLAVSKADNVSFDIEPIFNLCFAHGRCDVVRDIYSLGKINNIREDSFLASCKYGNVDTIKYIVDIAGHNLNWSELVKKIMIHPQPENHIPHQFGTSHFLGFPGFTNFTHLFPEQPKFDKFYKSFEKLFGKGFQRLESKYIKITINSSFLKCCLEFIPPKFVTFDLLEYCALKRDMKDFLLEYVRNNKGEVYKILSEGFVEFDYISLSKRTPPIAPDSKDST